MNQQPRVAAPDGGGDEFRKLFEESLRTVKPGEVVRAASSSSAATRSPWTSDTSPKDRSRSRSSATRDGERHGQRRRRDRRLFRRRRGRARRHRAVARKAEQAKVWRDIEEAFQNNGVVEGIIVGKVKGGLKVDVGVPAFLPGSHADLRPARNLDRFISQRGHFAVLKFNRARGNVVVSRRAVMEKRARPAEAGNPEGARRGRHPRGHRQEHHRLRRVRGSRRHRRPAARHRHVVGPRQQAVRRRQRRRPGQASSCSSTIRSAAACRSA